MSCKHEFWTFRNQPSICIECGKTSRENVLESKLAAAKDRVTELFDVKQLLKSRLYEVEADRNDLHKQLAAAESALSAENKKREQEEADCADFQAIIKRLQEENTKRFNDNTAMYERMRQAEAELKQNIQTKCEHYDRMTRELDEAITAKEQAEARYTGLKDCFDEQCKITDDVLALAEKLEKRNNGLQTFIETKSGEEKDWLNGLGIVHDCGWRDTVSARIMQAEASCAAMRGALEYYAGGAKYVQRPDGKVPISDDGGAIARAALSASSSAQGGEQGAPFDENCTNPDKEV